MFKYFIQPPRELFSEERLRVLENSENYEYIPYSEYNFFKPGFSSLIKKLHFEIALRLTRKYFYKSSAIDFGCADGIFLPSLSKYFKSVLAISNFFATKIIQLQKYQLCYQGKNTKFCFFSKL